MARGPGKWEAFSDDNKMARPARFSSAEWQSRQMQSAVPAQFQLITNICIRLMENSGQRRYSDVNEWG